MDPVLDLAREVFHALDAEGEGRITAEALGAFLGRYAARPLSRGASQEFVHALTNGRAATLDFVDVLDLLREHDACHCCLNLRLLDDTFRHVLGDAPAVSLQQLSAAMGRAGFDLSGADLQRLFKAVLGRDVGPVVPADIIALFASRGAP